MAYIPPNPNGQARMAESSPVVQAPQNIISASFSASGTSVLDSVFVTPIVGAGVTYNQGSGSLNILAGINTNAEFLTRSVRSFTGSMRFKYGIIASQRIAANNFQMSLADLVGEGLTYNIVSSVLVDVTLTAHGFTALNVGQFMNIAGITGAAGVPSRYAIQSIPDANTIRFTVAGWAASGTGTCTLFGYNQIRNLFTGTTATSVTFNSQRNGWADADTAATINTTATAGTIVSNEITGRDVFLSDALRASSTVPNFVTRASRYESIPADNVPLYVFIWSFNGTTPTATTFTLSFVSVEEFTNVPTYIQGFRATGSQNPIPTILQAGASSIGSILAANLAAPSPASATTADVASAAITTSAASSTLTPTYGCSYQVSIPVTLVSGTIPTYDVNIEESDDSGTNWFVVYSFPRITATGIYRSPKLPLRGNRIRYNQTLGGTSPSFTRAINRMQSSDAVNESLSQLIDRSIVLTTANSTTATINTQNGTNAQLQINIGAATTAPILQLEGSDDNGLTWYSIGGTLTAVANSTVQITNANVNSQLLRARVQTVGSGVIAGYVLIKSF